MLNDRSSVRPFFPINPSVYPERAKKFVPSGNGIRIITLDFFWESVRIWGIGIHRTPSWTPQTKSNTNVRTMFGFVLHVNSIFDVHKVFKLPQKDVYSIFDVHKVFKLPQKDVYKIFGHTLLNYNYNF